MMKVSTENGIYTIFLEGRIDSSNAPACEQELLELAGKSGENKLVIDAENLNYISSAGLRILLKLQKTRNEKLCLQNVRSEVYEIFETTGFTEVLNVQKALRKIDIEKYPVIGKGGNGTIYRIDEDSIVKVYKPWMTFEHIQREREYARTAFVNGIPSVIAYDVVKCGDCFGLVFEMLKSDTLGHAMHNQPEKFEEYVDKYVALAKTLHSTHVPSGKFSRIQDVYHRFADRLSNWCTQEEVALCHSIIDEIPETDTVIHNDLHPGNIMLQDGELLLIDMPEVTVGPAICDLVSVYRDMISAPSSENKGSIEISVGMPSDEILKAGNMFFSKYTGITDSEKLNEYYQKIGLLYAFNVSLVCGSGAERAMQLAPMIMDKLLRGIVIPNEQAIRQLYKVM